MSPHHEAHLPSPRADPPSPARAIRNGLAPQLSGRLRRRLGLEAGLNAGIASVKATFPSDSQPSSTAILDAVVAMIERSKGFRSRSDEDLRPGDWIQFEESFRYGLASGDGPRNGDATTAGVVYFAAAELPPFVLVGSAVHVLDRRQSEEARALQGPPFYVDAIRAYAQRLAELPDEGGTTVFEPPSLTLHPVRLGSVSHCIRYLCLDSWAIPDVSPPVRLSGHARVLAARTDREPRAVLATPLYAEYTPR
ncbi:SAVMC3_10250 family protein [Streptomyces sp. NPDC002676]